MVLGDGRCRMQKCRLEVLAKVDELVVDFATCCCQRPWGAAAAGDHLPGLLLPTTTSATCCCLHDLLPLCEKMLKEITSGLPSSWWWWHAQAAVISIHLALLLAAPLKTVHDMLLLPHVTTLACYCCSPPRPAAARYL